VSVGWLAITRQCTLPAGLDERIGDSATSNFFRTKQIKSPTMDITLMSSSWPKAWAAAAISAAFAEKLSRSADDRSRRVHRRGWSLRLCRLMPGQAIISFKWNCIKDGYLSAIIPSGSPFQWKRYSVQVRRKMPRVGQIAAAVLCDRGEMQGI
jgi:hypothetical protein